MKKTIIAFIMGVALATTGSVYAEDISTLVGKTIQGEFPVKVNGETLDKKAIVIDGTSYLPVRAIGDSLNMEIKFDADLGIELSAKEVVQVESTSLTENIEMSEEDVANIRTSEEQIELAQNRIKEKEKQIAEYEQQLQDETSKLATATDEYQEKQLIQMKIDSLKETIRVAKEFLQTNKDIIVSTQSYIAKIKAKYENTTATE